MRTTPPPALPRRRRGIAALATAAAFMVLGACADDGDGVTAPITTTTATGPTAPVEGLDFVEGRAVALGDGWRLAPCEAGPMLYCASHDGEVHGVIELMTRPVQTYGVAHAVLQSGGSVDDALSAIAQDFQQTFAVDRPEGCGAGYSVTPFGPQQGKVGGRDGIVYGFDGRKDGRHVERALQFATIVGDQLHLIAVNAVEPASCVDDAELRYLTPGELTALEGAVALAIADSVLP